MTCGWIKAAIAGVGFLAASLAPTQGQALCVGCTCTTTATGMNFGAYNLLSPSNLQSSGSIRVQCTLVLAVAGSYTIELSPGSSGTYAQRTLRNGASSLGYNLFTDPAHASVWGNGSGGTSTVTNSYLLGLLVVDQTTPVYGLIPAGQNVPGGVYGDSVVVTVIY